MNLKFKLLKVFRVTKTKSRGVLLF